MSFQRKLYFDSRYRSSGSHSDFTFQLSQSVEVLHGYLAIVDNVQIPNVFMTVDDTRNSPGEAQGVFRSSDSVHVSKYSPPFIPPPGDMVT